MDCNTCKDNRKNSVPQVVFESVTARQERTIRRLWITNIILILTLIVAVIWFEWRESQFADVVTTIEAEQESESGSNYAVGGDFVYGEAESQNYD